MPHALIVIIQEPVASEVFWDDILTFLCLDFPGLCDINTIQRFIRHWVSSDQSDFVLSASIKILICSSSISYIFIKDLPLTRRSSKF